MKFIFEITVEAPPYSNPEKGKWGEEAIALDWLCNTFRQAQGRRHEHILNYLTQNNQANLSCEFIEAQKAEIKYIDDFVNSIKFVRKEP